MIKIEMNQIFLENTYTLYVLWYRNWNIIIIFFCKILTKIDSLSFDENNYFSSYQIIGTLFFVQGKIYIIIIKLIYKLACNLQLYNVHCI